MAYSGTVSTTTFDIIKVIETALRRCKIPPEFVTSEMLDTAKDALYLLLSELPVLGLQLWALDKQLLALPLGQAAITAPSGTIDVENLLLRTTTSLACTGSQPAVSTYRITPTVAGSVVSTIGVKFAAAGTYTIAVETWNGALATTLYTVPAQAYQAGVWYWFDLDPIQTTVAYQVRETTGATMTGSACYLGNSPSEVPLGRINMDDYTNLPNKTQTGRPTIFWLDRQIPNPIMRIWPAPNAAYDTAQLVLWRQRYIMDVGNSYVNELEIPQRWYNAIVARLALRLANEIPQAPAEVIPGLSAMDQQAMQLVMNDERDKAPMNIAPNLRPYTA